MRCPSVSVCVRSVFAATLMAACAGEAVTLENSWQKVTGGIWAPVGFICESAGEGAFAQKGSELRVKFRQSGDSLAWRVVFRAKQLILHQTAVKRI